MACLKLVDKGNRDGGFSCDLCLTDVFGHDKAGVVSEMRGTAASPWQQVALRASVQTPSQLPPR